MNVLCFDLLPDINRKEWRYWYNPLKEREQKRMYYTREGTSNGGVYPWVYYLLGGKNEQFVVYNGFVLSDATYKVNNTTNCDNPNPPNVFIYPVEYNIYGAGSKIYLTYTADNQGNWQKDFKIYDHLGSLRDVFRKDEISILTFDELGHYDYYPFGQRIDMKRADSVRPGFIGKEKDRESNLGDFGVRKYDEDIGRFTSLDPLMEKYYGWTPYQYSRNNPVNLLDPSGYTDYMTQTTTFSDGTDNKLKFFVSDDAVAQNTIKPENDGQGPPFVNFESLQATGTFLGTSNTWEQLNSDVIDNIGKANMWREDASAVGITGDNKAVYSYGGQGVIENGKTNSTDASAKAINGVKSQKGISNFTLFHSHGEGLSKDPTNPGDYNAIGGFGIQSGVVIDSKKQSHIYSSTPNEQVVIPYDRLNKFMGQK